MKLDLKLIKNQQDEYHQQVAEIVTGLDAELERQKSQIRKIQNVEIELLKLMERVDKIEAHLKERKK